jgi:dihydrodipicolinate synthase/N-acetylneuraminate lyase
VNCPLLMKLAMALMGAAVLAGCRKPLLSPTDERTPYDRYDAIRNQASDQYVFDKYGYRRPNLKERLLPRD